MSETLTNISQIILKSQLRFYDRNSPPKSNLVVTFSENIYSMFWNRSMEDIPFPDAMATKFAEGALLKISHMKAHFVLKSICIEF